MLLGSHDYSGIISVLSAPSAIWIALIALAAAAGPAALNTPCGWNSLFVVLSPGAGSGAPIRRQRLELLALFGLGQLVSAVAVGGLVGLLGVFLRSSEPRALAILILAGALGAVTYGVAGMARLQLRVPSSQWVVPGKWATKGRHRFAFLFGLALGTGFMTIVSYFGMYLIYVLCLAGSVPSAIIGMVIFAMARWIPVAATLGLFEIAGPKAYTLGSPGVAWGIGRWVNRLEGMRAVVLLAVFPVLSATALSLL